MDKPTKPSNLMPRSFGGTKNNFSASLQSTGYEPNVPAIYGGDNLNYQLDATGKELDYCEKIVDFINDIPIGKTITVDSNNKLVYDSFVNKAGDTMTGDLTLSGESPRYIIETSDGDINSNYPALVIKNNRIDYSTTTTPQSSSGNRAGTFSVLDINDNLIGGLYVKHNYNNNFVTALSIHREVNNTDIEGVLSVGIKPDGSLYSDFPNTKCVDGQWTNLSGYYIVTNKNISITTNDYTDYDLSSYLPNDSYKYEITIYLAVQTGSTTGAYIHAWATAPAMGGVGIGIGGSTVTNREATFVIRGAVPVNADKKIRLHYTASGSAGVILNFNLLGYRRIGTNA